MTTPNPQPREGGIIRRDLYCRHAQDCLTVADRCGWRGLDCSACPVAGTAREAGAPAVSAVEVFEASDYGSGNRELAPLPSGRTVHPPDEVRCRRILGLLECEGEPLGTDAIARRVQVPRWTTYYLLQGLRQQGRVRHRRNVGWELCEVPNG